MDTNKVNRLYVDIINRIRDMHKECGGEICDSGLDELFVDVSEVHPEVTIEIKGGVPEYLLTPEGRFMIMGSAYVPNMCDYSIRIRSLIETEFDAKIISGQPKLDGGNYVYKLDSLEQSE